MADKPHTESGNPKVRVFPMIDPDLKQRAKDAGINFSEALEVGVKALLNNR